MTKDAETEIECELYYNVDTKEIVGIGVFNGCCDAYHLDLDKEHIISAIKDVGAIVYVNDGGYSDRCYVNVSLDDRDVHYHDHSFEISPDLPSQHRLLRALENAHLKVVMAPDGSFTLVTEEDYDGDHKSIPAKIEINETDLTYKVVSVTDDDDGVAKDIVEVLNSRGGNAAVVTAEEEMTAS